jgi:hypothetical protein
MRSKYILFLFIILLQSCGKDVLNKSPLDKISDNDVWKDEVMVQSYVTNLYSRIPFSNPLVNYYNYHSWSDERTLALGNAGNITQGTVSKTSEGAPYWDYVYIRDCNTFLDKIASSLINQNVKKQLEGEVRFMRAFAYFEMMKRYGGVPLVDVVIDPFQPIDDKYQVRATEEAIANFINTELTAAVGLLSDVATPRGRVNKWTANALNARAMLWAASVAKYGSVQLNGVVGIPASNANAFYAKASAAAEAVITSGKYSLYNATPANKSENYRNIFMVKEHSEVIFEKAYDGFNIGHGFDLWNAPRTWSTRGETCNPTLDFLLGYENIDGSTTQPTFGAGTLYTNGFEPFANKDPRLLATVFFQGETFTNGTINTYEGIDPSATPTPTSIISSPSTSYNGKPSVGPDSRMITNDDASTNSGLLIKKFVNVSQKLISEGLSTTNWVEFRLAEMYLIKAEAEFEIGNLPGAVSALNTTRSRAGISLVDATNITREKVRTERRSELAFEAQRYWDLRRWRTAITTLTYRFQGLRIIFHAASGKYYFLPFNCESFTRAFKQEHYYNPITTARISNNSKLIENPLY